MKVKPLHEKLKNEAYNQGHCFGKGEKFHNESKANSCMLLMITYDLVRMVDGFYIDGLGSAVLQETGRLRLAQ